MIPHDNQISRWIVSTQLISRQCACARQVYNGHIYLLDLMASPVLESYILGNIELFMPYMYIDDPLLSLGVRNSTTITIP